MFGQMPRWKLFTVRGHDVYLEPVFLVLVAIFVFMGMRSAAELPSRLLWIVILPVSILWHEFGHAIAIKKYGNGPSTIVLQGLGGVTINRRRASEPPKESLVISAAGPAFSFSLTLVFGLLAFLYPGEDLLDEFFTMMAFVNAFWGVFNLLPIAPLDGGHIVQHVLSFKMPKRKALLYSAYVSLVAIVVLLVPATFIFKLSVMFTVILGALFVMHNVQVIQALKR